MKKILLSVAVVAITMAGSVQTAQAVPITGGVSLDLDAGATVAPSPAGSWGAATGVNFTGNGQVTGGTGTFVPAIGQTITLNDFTFSPSPAPFVLWSFGTYSFTMTSITINAQGSYPGGSYLVLSGQGSLVDSSSYYDTTVMDWTFASTQSGSSFSFSSTAAAVPEPASLLMLGLGLAGVARVARRRS